MTNLLITYSRRNITYTCISVYKRMPSVLPAFLTDEKLMHNERLTYAELHIDRTLTYA